IFPVGNLEEEGDRWTLRGVSLSYAHGPDIHGSIEYRPTFGRDEQRSGTGVNRGGAATHE
ncbi:hypothetical protein CH063_09803, partial [Colletotrichum higginsianum]